jgi:pimeloyl-ACP methyl ester carboxylesterase
MPTTRRSGMDIHYEVHGGGPPIVLVHGLMGSSEVWRIAGWSGALRDHRLVMVDARGHGRSAAPRDPSAYSPVTDAADLLAVIDDAAIEQAAICGWSMGASIALHTAALHPERVRAVAALGLPPSDLAFADTPGPDARAEQREAERFEHEGTRHVVEALAAEGRPEWVPMIGRADGRALGARLRGTAAAPRLGARLRDLRQPLLMVWAEAEAPASPLPLPERAEVVVIPGEDHVGALGRIDVIMPALRQLLAGRE